MRKILLLGAGKIGRMIAKLLVDSGDYDVLVGDVDDEAIARIRKQTHVEAVRLDASDSAALAAALRSRDAVVSALSYQYNPLVAEVALAEGASYFDLTEDISATQRVKQIAQEARPGQIFMPQC